MKIIISNVSKDIKKVPILCNINMELTSGMVYGLQGKNGSGKTMLMRAICGLIHPTEGEVTIDGKVLGKEVSFPPSIGILLENPAFLAGYTGYENLEAIAAIRKVIGKDEINCALGRVGLVCNDKRTYKKYSLGMKQRLGIAAAIMEKPDLIILDEPFNALDESGCKMVRDIILEEKKRGALIILACHDAEDMKRLADEVYFMAEGKIQKILKNDSEIEE